MSPIPIASVTLAPQPSSSVARKAGSLPRLARDEDPLDARGCERAALCGPLHEMRCVRGRQHRGLGTKQLDRPRQPLGVPRADGTWHAADAVERGQGAPATNGPAL